MPALGESVTEGTVTRWLKQEGDTVEVDEPLLEVSTDKVDTEIPSPVAGVVRKILVGEDETVAVGADLAIVGDSDAGARVQLRPTPASRPHRPQAAPAPQARARLRPAPRPAPAPAPAAAGAPPAEQDDDLETTPAQPRAVSGPPSRPGRDQAAQALRAPEPPVPAGHQPQHGDAADASSYLTPLVRRLATEHGVDLVDDQGHRRRRPDPQAGRARRGEGQAGRAAAPARGSAPRRRARRRSRGVRRPRRLRRCAARPRRCRRLRRVIAQRMVESLQVSAQLTTVVEVDVTKIARLRDRAKRDFEAREGVKLSFLPFFALAAVEALKQYPVVNASIEGDEIVYHARGEPRRRRGHRARPARAGDPQRGRPQHRRHRAEDRRPRRPHPPATRSHPTSSAAARSR